MKTLVKTQLFFIISMFLVLLSCEENRAPELKENEKLQQVDSELQEGKNDNASLKPLEQKVKVATKKAEWKIFKDPTEGAFTIKVPVGWQVNGGINRPSALQANEWVEGSKGSDYFFMGDPNKMSYVLPSQFAYEGQMMPYGLVKSYRGAEEYVYEKMNNLMAHIGDVEITEIKESVESKQLFEKLYRQMGMNAVADAKEIRFTYSQEGVQKNGVINAAILLNRMSGSGMWFVAQFDGIMGDDIEQLEKILAGVRKSYRANEQWVASNNRAQQKNINTVRNFSKHEQKVYQNLSNDFQEASEKSADNWGKIIGDQTDVRNPNTGEVYRIDENYHDSYYQNSQGDIIGVDGYENPDPLEYEQMEDANEW